jgi:tetratricopeptide (TPR) repeat protein
MNYRKYTSVISCLIIIALLMFLIPGVTGYTGRQPEPVCMTEVESELMAYDLAWDATMGLSANLSPEDRATRVNSLMISAVMKVMQKRYDEALVPLEKVLLLNESYVDAWYYKGYSLYWLNQTDPALQAYEQALLLDPDYYNAWLGKSLVYFRMAELNQSMIWVAFNASETAIALKEKQDMRSRDSPDAPRPGETSPQSTKETPFPQILAAIACVGSALFMFSHTRRP